MVTAMWTSVIIKEPDNYGGRELFFFCLSTIKWVENSQQRKKRKKKKKDSQTVGYWGVVFTSIRRSERTFLGTTVIFLKKLQMCLQMKNTLFHGSPVPRKWLSRCSLTNGRDPPGALWQMKVSSLIGKTPVTCFCRKASALFLPWVQWSPDLAFWGKPSGFYDNPIFPLPREHLLCQSHILA